MNKNFYDLNQQQQILDNANRINSILESERVLADFGIRVIGQVASESDLEGVIGETYGDAYAIGTEAPYSFAIWTRADIGSGHPEDYWFNIGQLAIVGPQGPEGPQGPQGEKGIRGSQWFSGNGQPTTTSGYLMGDYYININTGNIWHLHQQGNNLVWLMEGNIKGPQGLTGATGPQGKQGVQGPAGPQGRQGNPGQTVHILGTIISIDQLPDPSTVERNGAYLNTTTNDLYVVSGTGTLYWLNAGPFNAGSLVYEGSEVVPTFNADLKLDNMDNRTGAYWTSYNRFFDRYYPLVEVSAAGIRNYTWKKAINKSQSGEYPGSNEWNAVQRGDPVVRMASGDILLPPQLEGGGLGAVHQNWVYEHFEERRPFTYYIDGYLTLPVPVDAYKGFFGYPNYFDDEELENISNQVVDSTFTLYITDCSGGQYYEAETFYDIVDSGQDISSIINASTLRIDDKYYNIKYMGYYYDEDSGTETFRITAMNGTEQITIFYYFYSGTGEEGKSLQEFGNQSTLRVQY